MCCPCARLPTLRSGSGEAAKCNSATAGRGAATITCGSATGLDRCRDVWWLKDRPGIPPLVCFYLCTPRAPLFQNYALNRLDDVIMGGQSSSGLAAAEDGSGAVWTGRRPCHLLLLLLLVLLQGCGCC